MSDIFLRSDADLDQKIAECNDPEKIREITKTHFAAHGIIERERGADFGARIIRQQPTDAPNVSLPASGYKFEHEFKFNPESGRRSLILRANTKEDLADLIAQMEKTV
jgi:hypothetical protein